jgi:hypothetical protein
MDFNSNTLERQPDASDVVRTALAKEVRRAKLAPSGHEDRSTAPLSTADINRRFLECVYDEIDLGSRRSAMKYVFKRFNQLLAADKFADADYILSHTQPHRLDVDTALSFLTITFAARHQLTRRAELYDLIYDRICELVGREKTDRLLTRLR